MLVLVDLSVNWDNCVFMIGRGGGTELSDIGNKSGKEGGPTCESWNALNLSLGDICGGESGGEVRWGGDALPKRDHPKPSTTDRSISTTTLEGQEVILQ